MQVLFHDFLSFRQDYFEGTNLNKSSYNKAIRYNEVDSLFLEYDIKIQNYLIMEIIDRKII